MCCRHGGAADPRVAGWASAALLLGVWPGNLQMALDSNRTSSTPFKVIAWGRMPLQLPLIRAAVAAGAVSGLIGQAPARRVSAGRSSLARSQAVPVQRAVNALRAPFTSSSSAVAFSNPIEPNQPDATW